MSGVPTRTYKLTTIQDAVTVGTTLSRSWYRGHSRIVGELTPRVYRGDIADDVVRALRPFYELEFIDAFRNGAPTLAEAPIPAAEDRLG